VTECFCCSNPATKDALCPRCYQHCNQTEKALWVEKTPSKGRGISGDTATLGEHGWVTVIPGTSVGRIRVRLVSSGKDGWAEKKDVYTTPQDIEENLAFLSWLSGTNERYWDKFYEREKLEKRKKRTE
jgi:hypothetical protein